MTYKLTQYYFDHSIPRIVELEEMTSSFMNPTSGRDIMPGKPLFSPKVGVWDYGLITIFSGDK